MIGLVINRLEVFSYFPVVSGFDSAATCSFAFLFSCVGICLQEFWDLLLFFPFVLLIELLFVLVLLMNSLISSL